MRTVPLRTVLRIAAILLLLGVGAAAIPSHIEAAGDKVAPRLKKEMAAAPDRKIPVIVEMAQPAGAAPGGANERRAAEAATLLDGLGPNGKRVGTLPLISSAAGFANPKGIEALSRNPGVAYIHYDAPVMSRTSSLESLPVPQGGAPYPFEIRANKAWSDGITGKGVGVAVLDSGIAPSADLVAPSNRVVAAVNFAGDLSGMPDAGGHGTHVAGVIGGNSTGRDLARQQVQFGDVEAAGADYMGVAPGANLVDVRVLNSLGQGRISSVVAGIQWVLSNRDRYNIRVINLSLGAPINDSYRNDPLSAAVEIAWKRGIVVVAAAGNSGPAAGAVETPGIDPFVVTVGAVEDRGTTQTQDDIFASFSAWGTPTGSTPKPDLVAPGRRIVSIRVPDSQLDRQLLDRVVIGRTGPTYFRLTGTSASAAMVSGTVALMLERRPGLSPDQVKATLVATAQPFGQNGSAQLPNPAADGAGLVNSYAAATSTETGTANRGLRPSDGLARALYPVLYGQTLPWKDPNYAGTDWNNLAWDNLAWDNLAWDNLAWDNLAWDNLAWDNLAWDNLAWDNLAWDNLAWDGNGWSGATLD